MGIFWTPEGVHGVVQGGKMAPKTGPPKKDQKLCFQIWRFLDLKTRFVSRHATMERHLGADCREEHVQARHCHVDVEHSSSNAQGAVLESTFTLTCVRFFLYPIISGHCFRMQQSRVGQGPIRHRRRVVMVAITFCRHDVCMVCFAFFF